MSTMFGILLNTLLLYITLRSCACGILPTEKPCADYKPLLFNVMDDCIKRGLVASFRTLQCYSLLNQDPCSDGYILVFSRGPCMATTCRKITDNEGEVCEPGWYNYRGVCTEAGANDCDGVVGKRVHPDMYGEAQCVCDQELGFVEMEGQCYIESLQGPCGPEELINTGIDGEVACIKNTCDTGYIRSWTDGVSKCYPLQTFFQKLTQRKLTANEQEVLNVTYRSMSYLVTLSGTFNNCHRKAGTNGQCLKTHKEPGLGNRAALMLRIRAAFGRSRGK